MGRSWYNARRQRHVRLAYLGGNVVTDLGGSQISSLVETLPGIALVLRSPVANAFVHLIRASARQDEFLISHAEEVMKYAVRRNLIDQEESERVIAEARDAALKRAEKAADRVKARKASAKVKAPRPAVKRHKPVAKKKKR